MYVFMATDAATGVLVSAVAITAAKAVEIMGNLHVSRIAELNDETVIVETTGDSFRYFFDRLT